MADLEQVTEEAWARVTAFGDDPALAPEDALTFYRRIGELAAQAAEAIYREL